MIEPNLKTFSILATGSWYDEEIDNWTEKLDEDQPFIHIEDEFVNDTERRIVIKNTTDQTYWAVNADYNGDSWNTEEGFEEIVRGRGVPFRVYPTEVVVTQYLSQKEIDETDA